MNILALDLGTQCGYAVTANGGKSVVSGTWKLKPSRFQSAGERFRMFKSELMKVIPSYAINYIVFEEVRNHRAIDAAHVYGGLLATLQVVAEEVGIPYSGVGVSTIKKHATGNHQAKKPAMIAAAQIKNRGVSIVDDNQADALCLLDYALNVMIF